jgi:hypothetical protein
MNKYRVSYQNHSDYMIRNKHARIVAANEDEARALVMAYGELIAIYKIELI